jgi:catechol 2,3-dioxygenase-like lactoylglutathione lyase family enzyme
VKLAHIVLRTSRFEEMVAWYKAALGARGLSDIKLR